MIEPGKTWALSRHTTRRYFLLNPDQARELEQCYLYCLGLCPQRFGVVVHAGRLMSTHSHEVVTDVRGVLPRFLQEFRRLLALTTKALRGWPGEVFEKRSTGQHELLTAEAAIEALGYLISNPVEAGAVRYAKDWPGAHTLPRDIGARMAKALPAPSPRCTIRDVDNGAGSRKNDRWRALDLLRLVAVVLMVQGHVFTALLDRGLRHGPWYIRHSYVHGLTAPIFFFASGLAFGVAALVLFVALVKP